MEGLRQYTLSILSAALISGILSSLTEKTGAKELIRLLCGVFMLMTLLKPIVNLDISFLEELSLSTINDAERTVSEGKRYSEDAMMDIIKSKSEAYILDKAAELNANLQVIVTVSEEYIPVSAELCGSLSPYVKERMVSMLENDLGITKENQKWTG